MKQTINIILFYSACMFLSIVSLAQQAGKNKAAIPSFSKKLAHLPDDIQPVIGAWFWGENDFTADGYKASVDMFESYSCYDLLAVGIRRSGHDITDIDVHNQVKRAAEYAHEKGLKLALELDPRIARHKFQAMYPDELQQSLWLQEVPLSENEAVSTIVKSIDLSDHMTGNKVPYVSLSGALLRVYSYTKTSDGIDPNTLQDISDECKITVSTKDSLVVKLPAKHGYKELRACVMVTFTHLYPDVFAPHLIEFTRNIIDAYADVPLAGGMRDEWGFPPSTPADRMAGGNHFWYSNHYAEAYAKKTGGRELLADCLLMYAGIKGKEAERYGVINAYMELNRERNIELENDFYENIKKVFGPDAAVVTHPTWFPYPNKLEAKKNGLYWWAAKRDWAQTDEVTPFAARTAVAKKWGSPVWYNQYYGTQREAYEDELWSSVLAGGRINYHPLYPSDKSRQEKYTELLKGELMQGESRVRLLNFISESPLNCPVAVVFGHPSAMNWAGPYAEDLGMTLINRLWSEGIPADLIPTSEIENESMQIDEDGWITYGSQRYAAVVLYHPEFEKNSTSTFFQEASTGQTNLFRIGNWTRDFNGQLFDGNAALPSTMKISENIEDLIKKVQKILKKQKIELQTPASRLLSGFGYASNTPPTQGFCRLIDGTLIQVAAINHPSGDPIESKMKVGKYEVVFNALGVAAVRLDDNGQLEALAAGGLTFFKTGNLSIRLDKPVDLAIWTNDKGELEGVIQGEVEDVPQALLDITQNWTYINSPLKFD
ncbi:hypothetical protein [Maribellus sp. YY47]|uniref:hypothetical protein n=1 Tax=Maribellus sp. YY47 TaxID=2929486 RepID=UPI00200128DC|nr:hypothetical protein [Maribellus sp. YY47]MCK3683466.1 hypothetical protein [Maribellus sp. YY47]